MSKQTKILLLAVLAVVLVVCIVLAFVLPGKKGQENNGEQGVNDPQTSQNAEADDATKGTEDPEGTSEKPGNTNTDTSDNDPTTNDNTGTGEQPGKDEEIGNVIGSVEFDDLLSGGNSNSGQENEQDPVQPSTGGNDTESDPSKPTEGNSGGNPAGKQDGDITIPF